jgi:SPP1 gp7 family putative phage head morphogenesis protein
MTLTTSLKHKIKKARLTFGNNAILDDAETQPEFTKFIDDLNKAFDKQIAEVLDDDRLVADLMLLAQKAEGNQNVIRYLIGKFTPLADSLKEGVLLGFFIWSGTVGGQGTLDQMTIESKPFLLENEEIVNYLKNRSLDMAKLSDETTRERLAGVLEEGRKNLLTPQETATLIADRFKTINPNRAALIARNELANAANAVGYEVFKRNGVTEVRWVTVMDDRVCPICSPLHNQVVGIDNNFTGKQSTDLGTKIVFEGERPPAHVNCRCYLEEVITGFDVSPDDKIIWTGQ